MAREVAQGFKLVLGKGCLYLADSRPSLGAGGKQDEVLKGEFVGIDATRH